MKIMSASLTFAAGWGSSVPLFRSVWISNGDDNCHTKFGGSLRVIRWSSDKYYVLYSAPTGDVARGTICPNMKMGWVDQSDIDKGNIDAEVTVENACRKQAAKDRNWNASSCSSLVPVSDHDI